MPEFVFKVVGADGAAKGMKVKAESFEKAHEALVLKGYEVIDEQPVESSAVPDEMELPAEMPPTKLPPSRKGTLPSSPQSAVRPKTPGTRSTGVHAKLLSSSTSSARGRSNSPVGGKNSIDWKFWGKLGALLLGTVFIAWLCISHDTKQLDDATDEVVAKVSRDPKIAPFALEMGRGFQRSVAGNSKIRFGKNVRVLDEASFKENLEAAILTRAEAIGQKLNVRDLTEGWWVRSVYPKTGDGESFGAAFKADGTLFFKKLDSDADPSGSTTPGTWEFKDDKLIFKTDSKTETKSVYGFYHGTMLLTNSDGTCGYWEHRSR